MKNALEKEEALDELGQSFQNYLSILHSDESVADSCVSNVAPLQENSRMVTLDPYTVNQKIRRASILHVKRLSSAVDMEEKKEKSHVMFWAFVALLSVAIGCSIVLVIWKTTAPPSSTISDILPRSIVTPKSSKTLIDEFHNKLDAADVSEQLENLKLPAFTETLVDRNRVTEIRKVPLLLDIPGTGSEYLSPVLTKCLGLSSTSNFRELQTENSPNFAVTEKLCGITNKFQDDKAWLMVIMRNPVVRVVQEYLKMLSEKKTSERNVAAYVNSPSFVDNRQTRVLICKPAGKINEKDFNVAKFILTNMSVLSMYQDYSNSFKHYREAFSWTADDASKVTNTDSNQCIEDEFLKSASRTTEGLEKRLNEKDVVKNVRDKNEFDMKLYLYALSLNT